MRLLSRLLPLTLAAATLVAGGLKTQGDVMAQKVEKGGWRIIKPGGGGAQFRPTVSPHDPNIVLVACDMTGSYITRDGGSTWRQFNLRTRGTNRRSVFDESAHTYGVALDPENPSTVFINTFDGAAYRSDDSGRHWRRLGGYNFKWGHRPVPDPHRKSMLYLTTFGSSVWHGPADGAGVAFEDVYPLK